MPKVFSAKSRVEDLLPSSHLKLIPQQVPQIIHLEASKYLNQLRAWVWLKEVWEDRERGRRDSLVL